MGKHCSNQQCFKEKNYKAKFATNLIVKKIKLTKIILKKKKKKIILRKKKKKHVGEWKKNKKIRKNMREMERKCKKKKTCGESYSTFPICFKVLLICIYYKKLV